jgi:hypothetical protein
MLCTFNLEDPTERVLIFLWCMGHVLLVVQQWRVEQQQLSSAVSW